jgi:hypothetical protein
MRKVKIELTSREKRVQEMKRQAYKAKRAETHPMELEAGNIVWWAKKLNLLQKAVCCSECGTKDTLHYHHDDYEFPLAVRALCASCHKAWHRENEPLNAHWARRNEYRGVITRLMFERGL